LRLHHAGECTGLIRREKACFALVSGNSGAEARFQQSNLRGFIAIVTIDKGKIALRLR